MGPSQAASQMHGVRDAHFDHYNCEFMYRYDTYCKSGRLFAFEVLLKYIAEFYKV